ncbi:MAG TPA: hypothetical protein VJC04_00405 [Candidatus Paceibacterota bacterium]
MMTLTMELLREFLGGPIRIDNPTCQYCGSTRDISVIEKNGKIIWIGFMFRCFTEIEGRKPRPETKRHNWTMDFFLKGKASIRGHYLIIPTDIRGEELKIKR